jgi:cystathionine beta-synthase
VPLVLLPDNGTRYLSKTYNDDWMRENGLLEEPEVVVKDFFRSQQSVITCKASELVKDIIAKFKEHGISQMPVIHTDGSMYGIIAEYDLLQAITGGSANLNKPIDPFVVRNVDTVALHSSLRRVQEILKADKVPIVVENGKILGVITKIDILDYFVNRGNT